MIDIPDRSRDLIETESEITARDHLGTVASAIVDLINSRSRSPTHAEIEGLLSRSLLGRIHEPHFLVEVRRLRKEIVEAVREGAALEDEGTLAYGSAFARADGLENQLHALTERIWEAKITSWADIVAHCEIALRWIDRDLNGDLEGLREGAECMWERSAAHLVKAVAELGGCDVRE